MILSLRRKFSIEIDRWWTLQRIDQESIDGQDERFKKYCFRKLELRSDVSWNLYIEHVCILMSWVCYTWTMAWAVQTRRWIHPGLVGVCVCVFFPSILDIKFVGRTSRGHTGGRSHRIFNPPSFCGACLDFCREKDSAIPFPRRPWSRILCTNELIVLHPLGIFILVF